MLANKLAELRRKHGQTHDDLAKYLNITRQGYSHYESGKNEMSYDSLCRIADLYHVTTDYLLGHSNLTNAPFCDEELKIIHDYRGLDGRGKETVKAALAFEKTRAPAAKS